MTEPKEHLPIRQSVDNTLSGLNGNPLLFERLVAQSAQKKEGVNPMKFRPLIVIALVAMLCMGVAVASELLNGTVDWDGNLSPHDTSLLIPNPTAKPDGLSRTQLMRQFADAHKAKEGELVIVTDLVEREQGGNVITRRAVGWDAFRTLMADSVLPLPVAIPEGYALTHASVRYDCRADGAYRLIDTVESEDGFRAETYVLDAENAVVIGYDLTLMDADGKRMDVFAYPNNNSEEISLTVYDAVQVRTASVPGMEKAVLIEGETNQLVMYSMLPQPLSVRIRTDEVPADYTQIYISVHGTASAEDMLTLFGGK